MAIGRLMQRKTFNHTRTTRPSTQSEWKEWQTSD